MLSGTTNFQAHLVIFLPHTWNQPLLHEAQDYFFFNGKQYLDIKTWWLNVLICTVISLLLCPFRGERERQRNHIDNLQQHGVPYCMLLISLLSQYVRMIVTPHNIFALTYMHHSQNSTGMTISISQPSARLQVNTRLYSTKLYKVLLSVWCTVRTACFCWSPFVSHFSILADVALSPEHTYGVNILKVPAPGFLLSQFPPISFSLFCLMWSPLNICISLYLSLFSVPIAFTDRSQVLCPVLEPPGCPAHLQLTVCGGDAGNRPLQWSDGDRTGREQRMPGTHRKLLTPLCPSRACGWHSLAGCPIGMKRQCLLTLSE